MNAVVLLSGGPDSIFCLLWAKRNPLIPLVSLRCYDSVRAVFFDYGQSYREAELVPARKAAGRLHVPLDVLKLSLPSTIGTTVPGRNCAMVRACARPGEEVLIGVRNLFSCLDKHGDASLAWIRSMRKEGYRVRAPALGLPKFLILGYLWWSGMSWFSSEGLKP